MASGGSRGSPGSVEVRSRRGSLQVVAGADASHRGGEVGEPLCTQRGGRKSGTAGSGFGRSRLEGPSEHRGWSAGVAVLLLGMIAVLVWARFRRQGVAPDAAGNAAWQARSGNGGGAAEGPADDFVAIQ